MANVPQVRMTSTPAPAQLGLEQPGTIYNRVFWLAYAANVSLVMANALTFRFAEFVAFLGGSERISGTIVSAGICGALLGRLMLGQAIDRYGVRLLWIVAAALFTAGNVMFLFCSELSWMIYAARVCFALGLSAMFTCSIVHIQNQVPANRRTEIIASLGSSGFIGMIAGAQLGDWILNTIGSRESQFLALFGGAASLGVLYVAVVVYLTWGDGHDRPHETPAVHRLMFRYWPGWVMLVAVMMGIGFAVITVFLTRFATHHGLRGIGTFFTGYAGSAFIFRLSTRQWGETVGRHRMIVMGLCGHWLGHWMLPFVTSEWHFILPSIACGWGHALLFPAVISRGSGAFPIRYRGSGTTLVLGFFDIGSAISAPILGGIIDYFDGAGFPQMFFTSGSCALVIAIVYALTAARRPDEDHREEEIEIALPVIAEDEETDSQREPEDEPVTVPFPHVGHNA